MTKFFLRDGFPYAKKHAQLIGSELERINESNGRLTAQIVLDSSRKPSSKLHRFFEWDDDKASELYRKQQARHLINSVTVNVSYDNKVVEHSAFLGVSKKINGRDKHVYLSVSQAMSDDDSRKQLIAQAISELEYWKDKYAHIKELSLLVKSLETSKKKTIITYGLSKAYSQGVYR